MEFIKFILVCPITSPTIGLVDMLRYNKNEKKMNLTNSCKKMFHCKYSHFTFHLSNPLANLLASLFFEKS